MDVDWSKRPYNQHEVEYDATKRLRERRHDYDRYLDATMPNRASVMYPDNKLSTHLKREYGEDYTPNSQVLSERLVTYKYSNSWMNP